jgi:hypothetical protein
MIIYRYLLHEEVTEHRDISTQAALQNAFEDIELSHAVPKSISTGDDIMIYSADDIQKLYLQRKQAIYYHLAKKEARGAIFRALRDLWLFGNDHNL